MQGFLLLLHIETDKTDPFSIQPLNTVFEHYISHKMPLFNTEFVSNINKNRNLIMVHTYINMLNVNQLWPRTPTTQIRSLKVCFKWKISTRIYGVRLVKFNKLLIPNIGAASHQPKTCNLMYTRITQAHITGISFTLFMRNPIFFLLIVDLFC